MHQVQHDDLCFMYWIRLLLHILSILLDDKLHSTALPRERHVHRQHVQLSWQIHRGRHLSFLRTQLQSLLRQVRPMHELPTKQVPEQHRREVLGLRTGVCRSGLELQQMRPRLSNLPTKLGQVYFMLLRQGALDLERLRRLRRPGQHLCGPCNQQLPPMQLELPHLHRHRLQLHILQLRALPGQAHEHLHSVRARIFHQPLPDVPALPEPMRDLLDDACQVHPISPRRDHFGVERNNQRLRRWLLHKRNDLQKMRCPVQNLLRALFDLHFLSDWRLPRSGHRQVHRMSPRNLPRLALALLHALSRELQHLHRPCHQLHQLPIASRVPFGLQLHLLTLWNWVRCRRKPALLPLPLLLHELFAVVRQVPHLPARPLPASRQQVPSLRRRALHLRGELQEMQARMPDLFRHCLQLPVLQAGFHPHPRQ